MAHRKPIRLPRQWTQHVKSGILHAISLASVVLTFARSRTISRGRLCGATRQIGHEFKAIVSEAKKRIGRSRVPALSC